MDTKDKLVSAATQWDMKQSKKRGHNIWALGMYFQAIDDAAELVTKGKTWQAAINECFNDRLRDHLLKAI